MKIDKLLEKHGVSAGAAAKIRRAAKRYMREGANVRDAQREAVREHIEDLRERQEEILTLSGYEDSGHD